MNGSRTIDISRRALALARAGWPAESWTHAQPVCALRSRYQAGERLSFYRFDRGTEPIL